MPTLPPFLDSPFALFLFLAVSGTALYLTLAGASYAYFFVARRSRFLPNYVPNVKENRKAIGWGIFAIIGGAALTTPVHWLIAHGYTRVYYDIDDYGWPYFVLSFVLYMFITETLIYWIHRALHHPKIYKAIHLKHHEFRQPTPWVGVAFNPLDSWLQSFPHHLCALVLPLHAGIYFGLLVFVQVWAVMIHDRLSFVRWGFINYTGHHTAHHHYNKYNYGQFFTFWDRWAGTYKDPHDVPERFLLPRPARDDEATDPVPA